LDQVYWTDHKPICFALKLHPLIYITTQLNNLLVDYVCRDALLFSSVAWSHFMVPSTLQLFFCFLFFQNSSVTMASNPPQQILT
jgi:hypothetical protein